MSRRLVVAGGLGLAAVAAVLLLVRSALEPAALRAAAESRLSAMLGQPVAIGSLRVTLLPPAVVGSDVRVGAAKTEAPALTLERVRIVPQLRSLLGGPLQVEEVRLEGLVVSALRDRDGRWYIPAAVPAPGGGGESGVVVERVRFDGSRIRVFERDSGGSLREAASLDDIGAEAVSDRGTLRLSPLAGRLGAARVTGEASLDRSAARMNLAIDRVSDGELSMLLRLAGTTRPAFLRLPTAASASLSVQIDRTTARLTGNGSVNAPAVIVEPLELTALAAPYKLQGTRLTFAPTAFAFYRGSHSGAVTLDLAGTPARWSLDSRVANLDVGDFLAALTAREAQLDGTATVDAALAGRVGEPLDRTVQGRAHVVVIDGIVRRFPLLATVNRALRLTEQEAGDTRFERLSASLDMGGGRATTKDLVLEAGHVRMAAAGAIGFDRTVDLSGVAIVSSERSAAAIRSVHELAALRNARGELELPLRITGSADSPSIAIDLKAALGRSLRNELERRLRGWIKRVP